MNKDFWIGFLSCSCFLLLGLTQLGTKYKDESAIFNEFKNIYDNVQSRQYKVLPTTPSYTKLEEREIVFVNILATTTANTSMLSLLTRIGTNTFTGELRKWQ